MPGAKEAELKARRRRSAALLTSQLAAATRAVSRIPCVPNREPAGAAAQSGSKEESKQEIDIEDVVQAERAGDDGCCARIAGYWSTLIENGSAITQEMLRLYWTEI